MFLDEKRRRVNLGGRATNQTVDRAALIDQSKREREARGLSKLQANSALKIQSVWRMHRSNVAAKHRIRLDFDALLSQTNSQSINETTSQSTNETTTQSINQSTSQSTINQSENSPLFKLVRQFVFFASHSSIDQSRAQSIKALISSNLKSQSKCSNQHFGSSIALFQPASQNTSSSFNQSLVMMFRRFVQYLLADLQSSQVNQATASSSALLLFSLCNVQTWPDQSTHQPTYQSFIMQIFKQVVLYQPTTQSTPQSAQQSSSQLISWHEACRTRLLDLTSDLSLDDESSSPPVKPAIKNAVALLAVLACLPMEIVIKFANNPSINSSVKQSIMQTYEPSHRSIPLAFVQSYVSSILTIPLLKARLVHLTINQSIYQSLWAPHIADQSIKQAIIDPSFTRPSSQSTSLPVIQPTYQMPNQSANQTNSSINRFVQNLPISQTFTLVDRRPSSPVPMSDSSDSDSDDESLDQSIKLSIKQAKEHPRAVHSALWLSANMLDAMSINQIADQSTSQSINQLIPALSLLFPAVPASHFPSLSYTVHPALNRSFDQLTDRLFLKRLIDCLTGRSIEEVAQVCLLIDCLIDRLMNGSAILSAIAFAPGQNQSITSSTDQSNNQTISHSIPWVLFHTLDRCGAIDRYLSNIQPAHQSTNQSTNLSNEQIDSIIQLLCATLSHLLPVLSDFELYGEANTKSVNQSSSSPFPVSSIPRLVSFLVAVSYRVYWIEGHQSVNPSINRSRVLVSRVLMLLRDRQSRRTFTTNQAVNQSMWLMNQLPFSSIQSELMDMESTSQTVNQPVKQSIKHNRAYRLFANLPFVFPFESRLSYFYQRIDQSKSELDMTVNFMPGRGVKAVIRRDHVLDDGYRALHALGPQLKGRVAIEFVDESGVTESGLDGGGLFREFAGDVIHAAVASDYAFFSTSDQGELAPNPDSLSRAPEEQSKHVVLKYYEFIGQMIGKVLYEKLTIGLGGTLQHTASHSSTNQSANHATYSAGQLTTVSRDPQFALFFLRKLLEQPATMDDLAAYDPVYYRSLMSLTRMSAAELASLKLTFTADRQVSRMHGLEYESVPLIPGGQFIEVTPDSAARYVNLMADWRLNRSIHRQCSAFADGLYSVIPRSWLSVFAADELRVLISGKETIDLDDLRAHAMYSSGYTANHEVIRWFWDELQHWSHSDRAAFLKFVTSVPRAPLTGFQSLQPKFCIQRCDLGARDENSLPTSATCMNLLRLPRYKSQKQLGERMLYAVRNGLGFGLT